MTPKKNTPSCLSRFGVLGLAAATVVTGLTLSPTTPALAEPTSAPTSEAPVTAGAEAPIETAAVAAPVITKSTKYTNAAGETIYTFEGTRVAGADVRFSVGEGWNEGTQTFPSDTTFILETNVGVRAESFAFYQTVGGVNSSSTTVNVSDIVDELPVVTDLAGVSTVGGNGATTHRYTGKGLTGAAISVRLGDGTWTSTSATVVDGEFSFETTLTATEDTPLQVRQTLAGVVSAGVTAPLPVAEEVDLPFAMTSPSEGETFTPNTTAVFEGTGTPGSTIRVAPQRGLSAVEAEVNEAGRWTARKYLGTGTYVFDITQTSSTGEARGVINAFVYAPTGSNVDRNFEMITPRVGDSFTPDTFVHFVGQGTPGATITLKPQAGLAEATAIVGDDGFWKIRRGMGNGTYIFSATQTVSGVVTGKPIVGFVYGPTVDGDPITRPFAVTSHTSGGTFTPNTTVAISGTGTPNATVTLKPQGNLSEQTVAVSRDGYWVATRGMGNGAYTFTITQMLEGNVVGTPITDFVITPAQ